MKDLRDSQVSLGNFKNKNNMQKDRKDGQPLMDVIGGNTIQSVDIQLSGKKMTVPNNQTQSQLKQLHQAVILRDDVIKQLNHELNQLNMALRKQGTVHEELVNGQK